LNEGQSAYFSFVVEPEDLKDGVFALYLDMSVFQNTDSQVVVYVNPEAKGWPSASNYVYTYPQPPTNGNWLWGPQAMPIGVYYLTAYGQKLNKDTINPASTMGFTFKTGYNEKPTSAANMMSISACTFILLLLTIVKNL